VVVLSVWLTVSRYTLALALLLIKLQAFHICYMVIRRSVSYANYANMFCCVTQMYGIVNLADELSPPVGTIYLLAHSKIL
jgi:hypothetical protein